MAILSISSSLIPSISNLALIAIPINEAKVAFNRMFEFTNIEAENLNEKKADIPSIDTINIKNLSFRFVGRSRLLNNVNISLSKGNLTALIGESGGGKSTIANILQKYYLPETGNIFINKSIDINDISTEDWRNKVAVVPQDVELFNGNVLYNICLDNNYSSIKSSLEFIQQYGFDKYIDKFPNGALTILGEEGINLSGGQKQLISLMRALYKQPEILILDEATAAMDRETEQFVIQLLNNSKQKMTIFYISHRLHVLKQFADYIYILENGYVSHSGTHNELLKTDNFYSSYWKVLK